MGDHRASIKIEMDFHGVKDKCDMWINYIPDGEAWGVDDRITEFVRDIYERGIEKWEKRNYKYEQEQQEKKERKQLEELKKKYDR